MSRKQEFIEYINKLMNHEEAEMTDDIRFYWEAFCTEGESKKPVMTENGALILKYLQEHPETKTWKAKDVAEGLFISSRTVSGAMRKLTNDGFVDKLGKDPVIYAITEKGQSFVFEEEN